MQTQLSPYLFPKPGLHRGLLQQLGRWIGWSVDISVPVPDKCVVIGAHHTSGTDFVAAMYMIAATGMRMRWVTKDEFFKPGLSPLIRAMGGMSVNRHRRTRFVTQVVELFQQHDVLRLGIMPEGTRKKADFWRTGFYYIALGAGVPMLFGYADYTSKVVGIGGSLLPTGDIEADFAIIRRFYNGVRGRYPARQSAITLREKAVSAPARAPQLVSITGA